MLNNKNIISENRYLISDEVHKLLSVGASVACSNGKSMLKDKEGIYLVVVRVLKNDTRVIIYNYMYYPNAFAFSLLMFLTSKVDVSNSLVYSEWGNFLTLIDAVYNENNVNDRLHYNSRNEHCLRNLESRGLGYNVRISNYEELFLFLNLLTCMVSIDEMVNLIHLAYHKNHAGFSNIILDNKSNLEMFNRNIELDLPKDSSQEKINIINSCLFVVNDMKTFVNSVRDRGYVFNTGPQKWRGEVNSMNNFLTCIDIDYRNSLYRHNQYHVNMGNIDKRFSLTKSKFSYRNIHQNFGGVRWYSTKRTKEHIPNKQINIISNVNKKSFSEDSPIFGYLNQWLEKSPINNDTQIQIEQYLLDFSYISVDDNSNKNPLVDYNLISKKFGLLLLNNKVKLNNILNTFRKMSFSLTKRSNQKNISRYYLSILLKEVSNGNIIAIIYGRLMRIITRHNRYYSNDGVVDIFHDMANNIVKDYNYNLYNKCLLGISNKTGISIADISNSVHKYTFSDWKKDNEDTLKVFDDATLKGNIGGILVEWMIECNLIEIKVVQVSLKEKNNILVPTKEVLDTLGDKVKSLVNLPFRLPMIVKPKPYYRETINGIVKERLGGYLLNDVKISDSLIIYKWNLKEQSNIKDINIVYDLVNNINSVGYKINTDVLNFIYKYGVEYNLIEHEENPYLNKPKLTKKESILLESYLSKLELQENILGIAKVYSKLHEFFIPVRLDNRGRMYCISEYLNYQSNELAKSLLLFSRGEKLMKTDTRSINYFKAYGANCFGNKLDKKSWNDRTKWIDDNESDIINFHNGKLISQATNKLLFIAFCFEYNRWLQSLNNVDTTYFETYLPIQLDATCNGYQHLSLLSLDLSLAKELNLITSSWDDVPKDFYNFLSSNLIDLFREKVLDSNLSDKDKLDYNRLINLTIQRTIVKKGIMTIPYNVSTNQMIKYIKENFDRSGNFSEEEEWYSYKEDASVILKYSDFSKIAYGLREVLNNKFFKLKLLMSYLKEIARICTKLDIVIPWGLPSGVVVKQSYLATKEVRLKPFTYSKNTFSIRILEDKGSFNKSKQVRAFMPNLIHSLDAASLALLVDLYFKNNSSDYKNIYAIHDCFAVTANNVEDIMQFLKLVYVKIYSEGKYLKELDNEIRHQIKVQYGESCLDELNLRIKTDYFTSKYPNIDEVLGNKLPKSSKLSTDVLSSSSYIIN